MGSNVNIGLRQRQEFLSLHEKEVEESLVEHNSFYYLRNLDTHRASVVG